MTSHDFEGVRLPDAVAGHPALDFCNTRAGWGEERPKEYLSDAESLLLWCLERHLLRDETVASLRERVREDDAAAEVMLRSALDLREAVYDVALGARDGEAWDAVAAWALRARSAGRLVPADAEAAGWTDEVPDVADAGGDGDAAGAGDAAAGTAEEVADARPRAAARWELDPDVDAEAPLLAIAHAVDDLLTSPSGTTVGACPGHGCGWLFTDRRRRRRWCSMAACGNREKARRHARRAKEEAAA